MCRALFYHLQLLAVLCCAYLTRCEPSGFIFPAAGDNSFTVNNYDHMVVEYSLPYTTAIGIFLACTDTLQDWQQYDDYLSHGFNTSGPYENTGKFEWAIAVPENDETNSSFCQFLIFNASITSCSWGPFGLASKIDAANLTVPLYYSTTVEVLAEANTSGPVLWAKNGSSSLPLGTTMPTMSTINVTCPPTGIPPATTPIATTQIDFWPPLASNVAYPGNPF